MAAYEDVHSVKDLRLVHHRLRVRWHHLLARSAEHCHRSWRACLSKEFRHRNRRGQTDRGSGVALRRHPTREADRFVVKGQTLDGQWLQVAYVFDPPGVVYVIHARPLTDREKRQTRRRHR